MVILVFIYCFTFCRMARLDLDSLSLPLTDMFSVKIENHRIVQNGNYVLYTLLVTVEPYTWTVERRYSDFAELDKLRFPDRKKSFLPKKKITGNLDPEFITERKIELEKYLKSLLELEIWYQKQKGAHSMPLLIAQFLDLHQYEIHSIVDDLSLRLGKVGEEWINGSRKTPKYFEFTPIEMHSIGERMSLPEPALQGRADVSHLIEFIHSIHSLRIRGGSGFVSSSSILSNSLSLNMSYCKSLLALWLIDCDGRQLHGHSHLRSHLRKLVVHYSIQSCKDVLWGGTVESEVEAGVWTTLSHIDFSFNQIECLDESLTHLPNVRSFLMTHNQLKDIGRYMINMHSLTELDLSNNRIEELDKWNEKLGNIKILILAGNRIRNLNGISRLYSLELLDVSDNALNEPEDVTSIGCLPCLEEFLLEGNPITQRIDYRTRVLESFGDRNHEITLDGKIADARERNTIGVRLALRRAEKEKERKDEMRERDQLRYLNGD